MHEILAPLESYAVEEERQNLEVVVLLVAHHVDHLVDRIVLVTKLGCSDVLGHIHRGAVLAEQELLVETLFGEVCPYRAIVLAEEEAFLQSVEHYVLALKICI